MLSDFKKNKSPMATPNIPLIINVAISLLVKSKKDISISIMVIVKPITPIIFLIKLICKLVSDFPDNSNRITADDQQKAVKTANISPKLKFNFISCFKIKPKKIVETYIQFFLEPHSELFYSSNLAPCFEAFGYCFQTN